MILDLSEYQGVIDFNTLFKENKIDKVILRSTKKSGLLDAKCATYYNQIRQIKSEYFPIEFYKFMYAKDAWGAYMEIENAIQTIMHETFESNYFLWIDLEQINGVEHSTKQMLDILAGAALSIVKYPSIDLGIYVNYGYLKKLPDEIKKEFPIWLARYNNVMGNIGDANVVMWQYTSKGDLDGINGCVDISHYIEDGQVVL